MGSAPGLRRPRRREPRLGEEADAAGGLAPTPPNRVCMAMAQVFDVKGSISNLARIAERLDRNEAGDIRPLLLAARSLAHELKVSSRAGDKSIPPLTSAASIVPILVDCLAPLTVFGDAEEAVSDAALSSFDQVLGDLTRKIQASDRAKRRLLKYKPGQKVELADTPGVRGTVISVRDVDLTEDSSGQRVLVRWEPAGDEEVSARDLILQAEPKK